jgi:sialic acid synthase
MKNEFKLIAEIGCVHLGSLERAKELAKLAKISGADVLKTQKRNPKESTPKNLWNTPHPNQGFAYGKTYLEHRENLELPLEAHQELQRYCQDIGIEYSSSIWDKTSTKEIITLDPLFIKVPSACNHNHNLLDILFSEYNGDVHISLGMTTKEERRHIINLFTKGKYAMYRYRTVFYHCVSGYPLPFKQAYLKEIEELCNHFDKVGFSNHSRGIALDPCAFTLGARYFERHFIDDRTCPVTDAANSLEPQGFHKLKRDLNAIKEALKYKPNNLDEIELVQRNKLRS